MATEQWCLDLELINAEQQILFLQLLRFAKVVCPIIKPVKDKDVKTQKLSDQSQPSTFTSPCVDATRSQNSP